MSSGMSHKWKVGTKVYRAFGSTVLGEVVEVSQAYKGAARVYTVKFPDGSVVIGKQGKFMCPAFDGDWLKDRPPSNA